eukprot:6262598-Amphidinium_carterae.1
MPQNLAAELASLGAPRESATERRIYVRTERLWIKDLSFQWSWQCSPVQRVLRAALEGHWLPQPSGEAKPAVGQKSFSVPAGKEMRRGVVGNHSPPPPLRPAAPAPQEGAVGATATPHLKLAERFHDSPLLSSNRQSAAAKAGGVYNAPVVPGLNLYPQGLADRDRPPDYREFFACTSGGVH